MYNHILSLSFTKTCRSTCTLLSVFPIITVSFAHLKLLRLSPSILIRHLILSEIPHCIGCINLVRRYIYFCITFNFCILTELIDSSKILSKYVKVTYNVINIFAFSCYTLKQNKYTIRVKWIFFSD